MGDFELPKTIEEKEKETKEIELRKELEQEDQAEAPKEEFGPTLRETMERMRAEKEEVSLPEKKDDSFEKNTGFLSIDVSDTVPKKEEVKEEIKPEEVHVSSMITELDESSRLLSKKSSIVFVCVCVAVVFFCVGGIVGFYFGSKNAKVPEETNKKVITVTQSKQIENNFINDPELVEVSDSMENAVQEKPVENQEQ